MTWRSIWLCVRTLGEVGEDGVKALSAERKYGFILPLALTDRWLQDFTAGLRLTDSAAVLPSSMHSTGQKITLCAIVEYVCVCVAVRVG